MQRVDGHGRHSSGPAATPHSRLSPASSGDRLCPAMRRRASRPVE